MESTRIREAHGEIRTQGVAPRRRLLLTGVGQALSHRGRSRPVTPDVTSGVIPRVAPRATGVSA